MELSVKLKEGFFKTKDCVLKIEEGIFTLTTNDNLIVKSFKHNQSVSVSIFSNKTKKVEFKNSDEVISLLVPVKDDLEKLKHILLDLKLKIIFEE
jgi:hypothetical protein